MSKYDSFPTRLSKPEMVVYESDGFVVYRTPENIRQFYLTLNGTKLGFKNDTGKPINYTKWIEKWKANALFQLDSLEARIQDLRDQQEQIRKLLGEVNV